MLGQSLSEKFQGLEDWHEVWREKMIAGKLLAGAQVDLAEMQHDVYSESSHTIMEPAYSRLDEVHSVSNQEIEILDKSGHWKQRKIEKVFGIMIDRIERFLIFNYIKGNAPRKEVMLSDQKNHSILEEKRALRL